MRQSFKRRATSKFFGPAALTLLCAAPFGAQACPVEAYLSSVCIMAWPKAVSFGSGAYVQANGALLSIQSYTALFSLLGVTYGGNGTNNFQLPDLRGRMVVGAGQGAGTPVYNFGQSGGSATVVLTAAQLPAHVHTLTTAPSKVVVTTGVGSLAAQTSLSGVTASASPANLVLNGSTGGNFGTNPAGATLGTYTGTQKVYSDAAPTVAMKAGSITGSAAVSFTGNPATTLSGGPAVSVSGTTDPAGTGSPVSIVPPYLAMTYYIAINGYYPVQD